MPDLADRLREIVKRPVDTPEDADRAAAAARILGELLRAQGEARELIRAARKREKLPRPSTDLSGLPLHEAARRVLSEGGFPLPAHQIGAWLYARGWRHRRPPYRRPDEIARHIAARLGKHPETFERVRPNTWALREWEGQIPGLKRKPRMPLFDGPGIAVSELISDHPELIFGEERPPWRSS
jgi:hypothetical protein